MKIRILDDSIRLRLSQADVAAAGEQGLVEGHTRFPDGSVFSYALEARAGGDAAASYGGSRLVVGLPAGQIAAWAGDDEAVSLHGEVALPDGGRLKLLVEKDFRCLTGRPDEDQSGLFVNPQSGEC